MDLHHRDALAFPALETERLVLREVRVSDAEDILSFVGDPEFEKWNGGGVDSLETLAGRSGRAPAMRTASGPSFVAASRSNLATP